MNQFMTKEEIWQMFTSTIGDYMQNSDHSKNSEEIERLKNDLNTLKAEKEIWGTYLDNLKNLEQKLIVNQEDALNPKKIVSAIEFKSVISQVTDSLNGLKSLFYSLKKQSETWREDIFSD